MTVVSYSATLVQYVVYARTLGVGVETDALAIAIAWATVVAGLITTTLTGVALPRFVRNRVTDPRLARSEFRSAVFLAAVVALVIAVLTVVGGNTLAGALSPASNAQAYLAHLIVATAPLILAWTTIGILLAVANATEHYGQAAASGVAPSVVVIAALVLSPNPSADIALNAFVIGAVLQIVWLGVVARHDLGVLIPLPERSTVTSLARRSVPVVLTLLLFNAAILVARAIATTGSSGDVAVFDYAARLVLAGQQVLLAGVLAVALTKWSQMAGAAEPTNPQIGRTLGLALGLAIPSAVALALLAPELVDALLTGGRFAPADAARVADVLRWMAPGVAAQMVLLLGFRALTAYQALWSMAGIGVVHLLVLAAVALIAQASMGVDGIAAGLFGRLDRRARRHACCPSTADRIGVNDGSPGTRDSLGDHGRGGRSVGGAAGQPCRTRHPPGARARGVLSDRLGRGISDRSRVRPGRNAQGLAAQAELRVTRLPVVLFLHPSDELYGADRSLRSLVLAVKDIVQPVVVLPDDLPYKGQLSASLRGEGIEVVIGRLPVVRRRYLHPTRVGPWAVRSFLGIVWLTVMARRRRAVAVVSNTTAVIGGPFAARLVDVPHLWYVREIVESPAWYRALVTRACQHCGRPGHRGLPGGRRLAR